VRALELIVLYFGLPLLIRYAPVRIPPFPVLWLMTAYAWWQLAHDPHFNRARLWNPGALPAQLATILPVFFAGAALLWMAVRWRYPHLEWSLVRKHPATWASVLVLYPLLSVYPQGIVYRAYFLQRYAGLFPGPWTAVLASAVVFAFMHIIFRNPLAIALTFLGGLIFSWRYQHTGSLFVSNFEHALYGCWLFTVGLGQYFYHRAAREG
jgi:membrane protease YdiL (CAAX protease family)